MNPENQHRPPPTALPLVGQRALVIGATGGIGSAIARRLAGAGCVITALGRDAGRLAELAEELRTVSQSAPRNNSVIRCDFQSPGALDEACRCLSDPAEDFDIVVLASGDFRPGTVRDSSVEELDRIYAINVRAPYALIRATVDGVVRRQGQFVVISSSAALRGRASAAQYSASHAALRSLAESLRDELNADEVRVLSVYPGRTATGIWARAAEQAGTPYRPELLLQPEDIAESVVSALALPRTAELTDLHIRPLRKSY